ncbi:MAG: SDR family NAD(P)-dependent oxidoreductase [Polyangiaceae bacterium]|nr:SDR family NAD(P)-dependent oxidoreductase [Polyangiaceae bacterium]
MRELRGKVAVVTGGAAGIGRAIATELAAAGCRVVLVDLARDALRDAAASIAGDVTAHEMDVTESSAWEPLASEIESAHGGASLLVNNAGVTVYGAFADQSVAEIDRVIDVNLKGVLYGCRTFIPQLVARGGHIVNIASAAGNVAMPYQSTYSASKFAVRGFTTALRMELASRGVGVTAMLPGAVATNLIGTAASYDGVASRKIAELMLAYGVRPERVGKRVVVAIQRNEPEVMMGPDAYVLATAQRVVPKLLRGALSYGFQARIGAVRGR